MAPVQRQGRIEASPAKVWAILADASTWTVWDPDMSAMRSVDGTVEAGGPWTVAVGLITATLSFHDPEPPTRMPWQGRAFGGSMRFDGLFVLEPLDDGAATRFTYRFGMSGPLGALVDRFNHRALVDGVEHGLANLTAMAEGRAIPHPS